MTYYFVCVPYMVTRFELNILILKKLLNQMIRFSLLFPFLSICRIEYLEINCITYVNILFIESELDFRRLAQKVVDDLNAPQR